MSTVTLVYVVSGLGIAVSAFNIVNCIRINRSLTRQIKASQQRTASYTESYADTYDNASLPSAYDIERDQGTGAAMDAVDSGRATWRCAHLSGDDGYPSCPNLYSA